MVERGRNRGGGVGDKARRCGGDDDAGEGGRCWSLVGVGQ